MPTTFALFCLLACSIRSLPFTIGLIFTFSELGDALIYNSKVRFYYPLIILIGITRIVIANKKTIAQGFHSIAFNPFTLLFCVLGLSLLHGFSKASIIEIDAMKMFILIVAFPMLGLAFTASSPIDFRQLCFGLLVGLLSQAYFELARWQPSDLDEINRLAAITTNYSSMLVSGWMAAGVLIAFFLASKTTFRPAQILYGLCGMFLFGTLLLTGTRSSFVAFSVSFLFLLIQIGAKRAFFGVALFCILLALVLLPTSSTADRLRDFIDNPAAESQTRATLLMKAIDDFVEHPLIGTGLFISGDILPVINWDRNLGATETGEVYHQNYENVILTILVETGAFGGILCFFIVSFIWRRPLLDSNFGQYRILFRSLMLGSIIRGLFSGTLIGATDLTLFVFCVAATTTLKTPGLSSIVFKRNMVNPKLS